MARDSAIGGRSNLIDAMEHKAPETTTVTFPAGSGPKLAAIAKKLREQEQPEFYGMPDDPGHVVLSEQWSECITQYMENDLEIAEYGRVFRKRKKRHALALQEIVLAAGSDATTVTAEGCAVTLDVSRKVSAKARRAAK